MGWIVVVVVLLLFACCAAAPLLAGRRRSNCAVQRFRGSPGEDAEVKAAKETLKGAPWHRERTWGGWLPTPQNRRSGGEANGGSLTAGSYIVYYWLFKGGLIGSFA